MRARLGPYLAAVGACAAGTAVMLVVRESVGLATVSLVYLLVVFLSAVRWGRGPSLTASLLSFVSLNFFFTPPYHTLRVASSEDVIGLLVFLLVAEITARIVLDRLRLQREAAEAEALRKTDELRSALLSAVSHDLRTPLASIRIAATGLLQPEVSRDEPGRRELLQMIDAEAARLARLVSNLLDLSRIEGGVLKPQRDWRDLQEVIARAVDHLHDRLSGHRVVVDVPADLPLVSLDFTQIEDVLVNLLDNAVRYAPEETPIRISAVRRPDAVVVQVENAGDAIEPEVAERIFDRFYTVQRDRRGVGLGLAICKGLVEAHGGRIWVERPGEPGARFAFSLPLPPPAAAPTPAAPAPS